MNAADHPENNCIAPATDGWTKMIRRTILPAEMGEYQLLQIVEGFNG